MKEKNSLFPILLFASILLPSVPIAHAQKPVPALVAPALPTLNVREESFTQYPSLEPVETIYVSFVNPFSVASAVATAVNDPAWNCLSPSFYKVEIKQGPTPAQEVRLKTVLASGNDPTTHKPFTRCDAAGTLGGANLVLGSRVSKNDTVMVTLYSDSARTKPIAQSASLGSANALKLSSATNFTFIATPQSAPAEALTNGNSRNVGQLSLSLAESNLFPKLPFNTYLKSNNDLFSTDEKDSKSAFALTLGGQHDLFHGWYSPLQVEETVQGNQIATNLSDTTALNINFIAPWAFTKSALNNSVIHAPLPPSISIANLYTHRINQLVTAKSPALAVNDYSLNVSGSWSYITLPPSCKLIGWLNKLAAATKSCLGTAFDLGLWYLPLDLTSHGSQRAEGYGDASILIPLSAFNFASGLFPYLTSNDPTKVQIQIKYYGSVNASNNYARTKGWTYGLQISK
jgi:hypothetical protein